jgi:beta-mannosidase
VVLTDEGLDGMRVHVINDTNHALAGTIDLTLLRGGQLVAAAAAAPCVMEPRSIRTFRSDALLDGFHDVSYAYRFGPPAHDVVAATLYGEAHDMLSQTFWIRDAAAVARERAGAVVADARARGGSDYELTVSSERFLFAARIEARGFLASDNYFCLMPGATKVVTLHALPGAPERVDGHLEGLNLDGPVRIDRKVPAGRVPS